MVLSAQSIRELSVDQDMVTPFHERTVHEGKTFGLSAAGYDVRVDLSTAGAELHPGVPLEDLRLSVNRGEFRLGGTVEHFKMPHNVMGIVHDKSSWARKGICVQNTVIEPGWTGFLTLELTNHGDRWQFIKHGDPIAQIVFHWLDHPTEQPYAGKYQNQKRGPQPAIEEIS